MDRRKFLAMTSGAAGAGWMGSTAQARTIETADAAPAASPTAASEPSKKASSEQRLADFAAAVRYEQLPNSTVQAIKRLLIDTLACGFGAIGAR